MALTGYESVVDAYSGIGTITLIMTKRANRSIGMEVSRDAVHEARTSASRNHLSDCVEFIQGDAPRELSRMARESRNKIDALVVDPPRKGLERPLIDAAFAMRPARIVLVSCNQPLRATQGHCRRTGSTDSIGTAGGYVLLDGAHRVRYIEVKGIGKSVQKA